MDSVERRLEMKLYLVQHAKAASKDVDPQRPLTDEGRRDIEKVAAFIERLSLRPDVVWHSGKKRAAQTAETLAEILGAKTKPVAREGLAPNDDVTTIRDELASTRHDVMIVGHLPFLGKLVSLLLTGDESAGVVAFRQGGIVCLEQSAENQWQLAWMITPEILSECRD
jgi:phosphohistidine phosphatase